MVATIHSLPLELLRLIISNACPQLPYGTSGKDDLYRWERYKVLRAAAVVCSSWTTISQELLWREVLLESASSWMAFAIAPRYPSRRVIAYYPGRYWNGLVAEIPGRTVLEGLRGVEELCIRGWRGNLGGTDGEFKLDSISGVGFKGLKQLELQDVEMSSDPPLESLPFALVSLKIDQFNLSESDEPHVPGFATLCQPSLTSLSLTYEYDDESPALEFLPIAPQLVTLSLTCWEGPDPESPSTFLRACTSLRHLTTYRTVPEQIEALPVALTSWNIRSFDASDVDPLISVIGGDTLGLSELKQLGVGRDEFEDVMEMDLDNWEEFIELCREKGVEIVKDPSSLL